MRHRRLAAPLAALVSIGLVGLLLPGQVLAAAPLPSNDEATISEDSSTTIGLIKNDIDPDGDALHLVSVARPANGSVVLTPVAGYITYTPNRNFNGQDQFSYVVGDSNGETATGFVSILVNPVNDPPQAWDRYVTVPEDGSASFVFQALDPDPEGCDLTFITELRTGHGTLTPLTDGGCSPNGDMASSVYTPDPDYSGPDSISYKASDAIVQSNFATVFFTVTPVNDPPVAMTGSTSTTSGVPVTFSLRATDVETCDLVIGFLTTTPHGKLVGPTAQPCTPGIPNGDSATVTYTPEPDFVGTDTLTFVASDGTVLSAAAAFSIVVTAPPTVHVGDLDAATVKGSGTWQAITTIRIDGTGHTPRVGAVVRGTWSTGPTGSCTTTAAGTCGIGSGAIARKVQAATFTVTAVTSGTATYDPSANHDPDGDSNGTSIVVARP